MCAKETVLIIDDRRDDVDFLTENILLPAGYGVSVAHDGERGLQTALTEEPDLVIMDLNVPRLSGLDVLQRLREEKSKVPVILMSFHGSERAAVRAFRLGAQDYVIKPYNRERMTQSIDRALAEHRLRLEQDQLTKAIAYAHRHGEKRLKELNILSSIGKSVTALLDEDRLLMRIVEAAVYITGAEEGILFLIDPESSDLYMRAARGLGEKYARGFKLKVKDSVAGEVLRTGKPVIITSNRQGDLLKLKTGYLVKSLLHVPLKVGETVIGVLSVDHMFEDRTFSNHELYLLSTLADYAAIALDNARLRAQSQARQNVQAAGRPDIVPAPAPEAVPSFDELGGILKAHQEQIDEHLQVGSGLVSGLREQVVFLETWLDKIASQEQTLAQLSEQGQAMALPGSSEPPSLLSQLGWELDVILDTMVEGVLVIDRSDQIVIANQMAETILGRQLVGKSVEEVCDDPRWLKTFQVVKAAAELSDDAPGSELSGAVTRLAVAQKMLRALFRVRLTADRMPAGTVVILRDITAEREAQRAKSSFIDAISQELRTPTTSIIGYADLLTGESVGALEAMQRKFLLRIRANAERVGAQLNNLVSMANVDSRQLEVKADAMDLGSAIQEAVSAVSARIDERNQVLQVDVGSSLPLVDADPDAMYHVLTSLLQNAHRCSPDAARIALRANEVKEGDHMYVAVSVTDSGGGIAPEDCKKVFNRFYRSDDPTVQGLGDPEMSLPIVKVLVEAHGGRIWMDSVPGTGSTFTTLLPVYNGTP